MSYELPPEPDGPLIDVDNCIWIKHVSKINDEATWQEKGKTRVQSWSELLELRGPLQEYTPSVVIKMKQTHPVTGEKLSELKNITPISAQDHLFRELRAYLNMDGQDNVEKIYYEKGQRLNITISGPAETTYIYYVEEM